AWCSKDLCSGHFQLPDGLFHHGGGAVLSLARLGLFRIERANDKSTLRRPRTNARRQISQRRARDRTREPGDRTFARCAQRCDLRGPRAGESYFMGRSDYSIFIGSCGRDGADLGAVDDLSVLDRLTREGSYFPHSATGRGRRHRQLPSADVHPGRREDAYARSVLQHTWWNFILRSVRNVLRTAGFCDCADINRILIRHRAGVRPSREPHDRALATPEECVIDHFDRRVTFFSSVVEIALTCNAAQSASRIGSGRIAARATLYK